ncbi:hypothetical protein [Pseudobutyrivibrio sp. ACV-2]|uniref:hypothetical protein n=1 Tax=Pseudobutyrivibrio sp. ACV-2 TaxID=1520801 RepID=UPI00147C28F9|nr:hypothetical protein [Pseudobutyrivibrio sp. ACV-2]
MASNIYMCFVFLAIWKAADGAIDYDGYRKVIKNFMTTPPVSKFMSSGDLNDSATLKKGCCRCEIVVYSLPYEMSRRPQKSSLE